MDAILTLLGVSGVAFLCSLPIWLLRKIRKEKTGTILNTILIMSVVVIIFLLFFFSQAFNGLA